jgi:hypothetical protein
MPVAPEQQAEIVERADDALQLNPVDQEHGHRNLVLADVIEKHILKVLRLFCRHRVGSSKILSFRPAMPCRPSMSVGLAIDQALALTIGKTRVRPGSFPTPAQYMCNVSFFAADDNQTTSSSRSIAR